MGWITLVVLVKILERWIVDLMSLTDPMAARILVVLFPCWCRNEITVTAIAETVLKVVMLNQGFFSEEINVVEVAYPMAL